MLQWIKQFGTGLETAIHDLTQLSSKYHLPEM